MWGFSIGCSFLIIILFSPPFFRSYKLHSYRTSDPSYNGISKHASLKTTAAFIRFNNPLPERLGVMSLYEPYFASLTFSMPHFGNENSSLFQPCEFSMEAYICLARALKYLPSYVTGVLYFHFDLWILPTRFTEMDFSKIWYLNPGLPGVSSRCTSVDSIPEDAQGWWNIDHGPKVAIPAIRNASKDLHLKIDTKRFCYGWTDMYYLPRSQFQNFQTLSEYFFGHLVMHEIGLPTIIDIIMQVTASEAVEVKCWGGCCSENPRVQDIIENRCGHKLDWRVPEQADIFLWQLRSIMKDRSM